MATYFTDFSESIQAVDMILDLSELDVDFIGSQYAYGFPMYGLRDAWYLDTFRLGYEFGGERVVRNRQPIGVRVILFWYKPGVFSDVTATAKIYMDGSNKRPGVILRASGSTGKETGYAFVLKRTTGQLEISRYTGGTYTAIANVSRTIDLNTWYNLKAECTGTTVRMKFWAVGDSEPETWDLAVPDSNIARGFCGLFNYEGVISSAAYYKDFRVSGTPVSPEGWFFAWNRLVDSFVPYVEAEAGTSGGQVLKLWNPTGASGRKLLAWGVPDSGDIVEVVVRMKASAVASTVQLLKTRCMGIASLGASSGESGFVLTFCDGSGGISLLQYVKGPPSADIIDDTSLSSAVFPVSADSWFFLRLRHDRLTNSVKVKAWLDGDSEPEAWQIDASPVGTGYDAYGFIGVGSYQSADDTQTYDLVGVGTGGDTAPTEAS